MQIGKLVILVMPVRTWKANLTLPNQWLYMKHWRNSAYWCVCCFLPLLVKVFIKERRTQDGTTEFVRRDRSNYSSVKGRVLPIAHNLN